MRVEQRADGTIARILDPVEVNLYARALRITQQLVAINHKMETELESVRSRLAKAETDLIKLKNVSAPHLGKFYGAQDLLRASGRTETDATTGRLVLGSSGAGLLGYTQNLLLIPGKWIAMAFVRGPVRFSLRSDAAVIATVDDNGSNWRMVSLTFTTTSSMGELEVEALDTAAIDYIAVRMGD